MVRVAMMLMRWEVRRKERMSGLGSFCEQLVIVKYDIHETWMRCGWKVLLRISTR